MWQFDGFSVDAAQKLIQAGDGSGVAALAQLYPEYHQTSVRIPAAHVPASLISASVCCLGWLWGRWEPSASERTVPSYFLRQR